MLVPFNWLYVEEYRLSFTIIFKYLDDKKNLEKQINKKWMIKKNFRILLC